MAEPGRIAADRDGRRDARVRRRDAGRRESQRPGDGDAGRPAGSKAVQERPEQPLVVVEAVAPGEALEQVVAGSRAQAGAHRAAPGQPP